MFKTSLNSHTETVIITNVDCCCIPQVLKANTRKPQEVCIWKDYQLDDN